MTSDDNHDDDAQLQQLRAVWVSMREEDPPDHGLAALMAAARTKAAELEQAASPSWWQRIAATLRRPPVLALATVTLLLGGALIVTQRSSQMRVDATDVQTKGDGTAAPPTGSAVTVEIVRPTEPPADPVAAPNIEEPKVQAVKPAPKAKKAASSGAKTPDAVAPGASDGEAVESGPRGGAAAAPVLSIAQDNAPTEPAPAEKQETAKKPIVRTAPPPIEGEDRLADKDSASPTIAQLVKQCETAAARGDCAAVRALAQKIRATAPAAYRSKVATNAAINRCMTE